MTDPWQLVLEGRFTEAHAAYSQRIAANKDAPAFHNRGLVLLNLGRIPEAHADFCAALALRSDTDGNYQFVGITHWLRGERADAIATWKAGLNAKYTDAAGGVELPATLLYAAVKTGDQVLEKDCLRLLKRRWKPRSAVVWPGPVAGLHLGELSPGDLVPLLSEQPILRAREQCQADFHAGVYALRKGLSAEEVRRRMLAAAANKAALLEAEYYLAQYEVRDEGGH